MIFDKQAGFEWNSAITVTRVSTDAIDLSQAGRDIANADDLWLFGNVSTTFTADGSATLACDFIQSALANLSSADILQTLLPVTGKASLVAGFELFKTRLQLGKITKQYVGLSWTVATGPMTAGAVKAGFTSNVDAWKSFPRGHTNY